MISQSIITLLNEIDQQNGYISVSQALDVALYHPKLGYYNNNLVLGRGGDFITAPELSQLFGEIIGIWCIWHWQNSKSSALPIHIIELGPGSGTMMNDILRIFQKIPCELSVSLLEISDILKQIQQQKLSNYADKCRWYKKISDIPKEDGFTIVLANEFFDALPIEQWDEECERQIVIKDNLLSFNMTYHSIYEKCILNAYYMEQIKQHLQPGVALIIDYGDHTPKHLRFGDTLQAIKHHKHVSLLETLGNADISHQVDFYELQSLSKPLISNFYSQREFLYKFGIEKRLENLLKSPNTYINLKLEAYRLVAPQEMGNLFKVLEIRDYAEIPLSE